MKRGGPLHPKVILLGAALGIERYAAVGLLECLWHFTAQYAPRGDLGRYDDATIAGAIGWSGDAAHLVDTLVKCRLVDADPTNRLVVHDWCNHADDATKRQLTRTGQWFVNTRKKITKTSSTGGGHCPASPPRDAARQGMAMALAVSSPEEGESEGKPKSSAPTPAHEVLAYVNEVGGTHFEPVEANLRLIRARLAEYDDWTLAAVVRRQWATWKLKPDMKPYFRPKTLFAAENCAQYVGLLTDMDRAWIAKQRAQGVAS